MKRLVIFIVLAFTMSLILVKRSCNTLVISWSSVLIVQRSSGQLWCGQRADSQLVTGCTTISWLSASVQLSVAEQLILTVESRPGRACERQQRTGTELYRVTFGLDIATGRGCCNIQTVLEWTKTGAIYRKGQSIAERALVKGNLCLRQFKQ